MAAFGGHFKVVERLLQHPKVDPSVDGQFALRYASEFGHLTK